jgi:hypothetical protein
MRRLLGHAAGCAHLLYDYNSAGKCERNNAMSFRAEVNSYGLACQELFSGAKKQPLTSAETKLVEYYCLKLLTDIAPYLSKDDLQTP